MDKWLIGAAGVALSALYKWGHLIFDTASAALINPTLRRRLKEYEALAEDAIGSLEGARSEIVYWKSDAEYWRGRYEELESRQNQSSSTSTRRRRRASEK